MIRSFCVLQLPRPGAIVAGCSNNSGNAGHFGSLRGRRRPYSTHVNSFKLIHGPDTHF